MDKQAFFDETPNLDGPDYVALVIEWDQLADAIEDEVTQKTAVPRRHGLAAALAAIGAIALAAWGIHRLRLRAA